MKWFLLLSLFATIQSAFAVQCATETYREDAQEAVCAQDLIDEIKQTEKDIAFYHRMLFVVVGDHDTRMRFNKRCLELKRDIYKETLEKNHFGRKIDQSDF